MSGYSGTSAAVITPIYLIQSPCYSQMSYIITLLQIAHFSKAHHHINFKDPKVNVVTSYVHTAAMWHGNDRELSAK